MADAATWVAKVFDHVEIQGPEELLFRGGQVVLLLICAVLVNFLLQRAISRHLDLGVAADKGNVHAYRRLAFAAVFIPALLISLHTLGINMTPLFATGSVFALALGFGMKNMAENFISGVILRSERTTRPGNILELNGTVMAVRSVGLRSTKTDAFNGREILIPNSDLLRSRVGTFTLSDKNCRIHSSWHVSRDIDPKHVQSILVTALEQQSWMAEGRVPEVVVTGFEDDLVCYTAFVWLESPDKLKDGMSKLTSAIWQVLKDNDVALGVRTVKLDRQD